MIRRCTVILFTLGFIAAAAKAAQVTGSVVYANGSACAGAEVTLQGPTKTRPVLSGSSGRFLVPRVPAGAYTLNVKTPRGTAHYRVAVAEPSVDISGLRAK